LLLLLLSPTPPLKTEQEHEQEKEEGTRDGVTKPAVILNAGLGGFANQAGVKDR
jgi:hypothetical protein